MTSYHGKEWDHKRAVRTGNICAGHLSDAVYNALQRVIWGHHNTDPYWTTLMDLTRDLMNTMLVEASEHQEEWTILLSEALASAGDRCRSDDPGKPPSYKQRWQRDADALYDRLQRERIAQAEQEEANQRARDRRDDQRNRRDE